MQRQRSYYNSTSCGPIAPGDDTTMTLYLVPRTQQSQSHAPGYQLYLKKRTTVDKTHGWTWEDVAEVRDVRLRRNDVPLNFSHMYFFGESPVQTGAEVR
jgi:hypothetical protein